MSKQGQTPLIFGYGSLLSLESLRASVPDAQELRAAYIRGFRRDFSLLDSEGWVTSNLDVGGVPFCGVDIHRVAAGDAIVNGVVFQVDQSELPALLEREKDYELIETIAYDFHTSESVGTCLVFRAGKRNAQYDFSSAAQRRYLKVCLDGARAHGERFYEAFRRSTYIGTTPVCDIRELDLLRLSA
jgi:cation transport regulator ChaC